MFSLPKGPKGAKGLLKLATLRPPKHKLFRNKGFNQVSLRESNGFFKPQINLAISGGVREEWKVSCYWSLEEGSTLSRPVPAKVSSSQRHERMDKVSGKLSKKKGWPQKLIE